MDDLISRSAFEKFIKEKYKDGESTGDIKDQMLFDLDYQPTAYDLDKVIKQLELVIEKCKSLAYEHDAEFLYNISEVFRSKYWAYKDAIEIVRKGGVENEID